MMLSMSLGRLLGASCLAGLLALGPVYAQPAAEYRPKLGQQGKDVVWVPSADALVKRMLDVAKVTPVDHVIDLGSGDGRTVIAAAKRGAKATGVEYEQALVDLSVQNAAREGVSNRANFIRADLFETDFSHATVLTMFLLPDINLRLRPRILQMKPGTRVVSNTFSMDTWAPDQTIEIANCTSYCRAYFWIVPAQVQGTWQLSNAELVLEQNYQTFSGIMRSGDTVVPVANGKLSGDRITFTAGQKTFEGRVNGNVIEGTAKAGRSSGSWRAARV